MAISYLQQRIIEEIESEPNTGVSAEGLFNDTCNMNRTKEDIDTAIADLEKRGLIYSQYRNFTVFWYMKADALTVEHEGFDRTIAFCREKPSI